MDAELKGFLENLVSHLDNRIDEQGARLTTLIQEVKESLEREIGEIRDTLSRISARLDKIAAGAHYVTRLVEWSEKQDLFQTDLLQRVQTLERRVKDLEKRD